MDQKQADSTRGTRIHIATVVRVMSFLVSELMRRAAHHDQSKLESPEADWLTQADDAPFHRKLFSTTRELDHRNKLSEFLEHHYKHNRHHPEHFQNGINDMTLIDLLEMFADWTAASYRNKDGDIIKSIKFGKTRFDISDQLARILENTANEYRAFIDDLGENYTEE